MENQNPQPETEPAFDLEVFKTQLLLFLKKTGINHCKHFKDDVMKATSAAALNRVAFSYADDIARIFRGDNDDYCDECRKLQARIEELEEATGADHPIAQAERNTLFFEMKMQLVAEHLHRFTLDELKAMFDSRPQLRTA